MILLNRVRTEEAINKKYRGDKKIDKELDLLESYRDTRGEPEFSTSHRKAAKDQLKAESHEKCAYCEADVSVVAHGDLEHFRPKSVYWWLAYCYDNYLFSCQLCNQTYKSYEFPVHGRPMTEITVAPDATDAELEAIVGSLAPDPLDGEPRHTLADFRRNALREKAGLPDPYLEDPEPVLAWQVDRDNREVFLKRRPTRRVRPRRAFAAAESYLGLNREQLRRARWRVYEKLELFKDALGELGNEGPLSARIRAMIEEMTNAEAPFAGMARYFVREEWGLAVGPG